MSEEGQEPALPPGVPGPPGVLTPYFFPVWCMSGATAVIVIIGLVVPRGPNAGITRTLISMSAVCMYLFWLVVYMAQMNPIMCPKMSNTSLAWMEVTWGGSRTPQPPSPPGK